MQGNQSQEARQFVTTKLPPFPLQEYQRAIIFRLGRTRQRRAVGPGLFFVLPCVDSISVVDLRTVSFNVPPQEILSRDSVTVRVDAVVYYRIMARATFFSGQFLS